MSLTCPAEDERLNLSRHKEWREAKEVFLYMNKNVRISRDFRARWFFEHLDKLITLHSECDDQEEVNAETFGIAIMGAIPRAGPSLRENEKLRICTNTHITYFSKYYCLVFILDFSPSCFVSDDSGCVLYNKLVDSAMKCLQNITKSFTFAGGNNTYVPRIYASFCAFTPFLCFSENSVLLQSVLLSYDNVNGVIDFLRIQIKNFIDKLCVFAQPHMKEWSRRRRLLRKNNENDLANLFQQFAPNSDENEDYKENVKRPDPTARPKDDVQMSDHGFIQPDWALIFMLRMGLMSAQNCLADNIQSNIIIVTDGVCGIPDSQALQNVLAQIRSFSISCSFIQLNQTLRGPTLGHVGFPELFHFLATATFGYYLTEPQLNADVNSSGYNIFHRSFLAWSFQRALIRNTAVPDIVPRGLRTMHIRNRRMSRVYEATLCRLLYVRLREGYTIKHLEIQRRCDDSETIFVKLSLLWKPQTSIEYIISAPWNGNPQKKNKIQVDVFVDAVVNSTSEASMEAQNNDAVKSVILNISDADCLMLHLHLFNCDVHYYKLPKEIDESFALFEYRKHAQRPILNPKYECLKNSKFIAFWQPLCVLDERIWQKWAHTHTVRAVLNYDAALPDKLFIPTRHKGRYAEVSAENAFQIFHSALKRLSTFTLIKEQSYVTILYESSSEDCVPKYFYIIRVSVDMPFVILKVAFLGGVPGPIRKKIMSELKKNLEHLRMQRESIYMNPADDTSFSSPNHAAAYRNSFAKFTNENALCVIAKPLERTLVRYRRSPKNLSQLVRLERSDKLRENREMILHNAIAKYLSCRRQIWQLRCVFLKNVATSNHSVEFIMQTILRRRLNQGFHIAYGKNGIVNLIRQRDNLRVDQCVLFGPTFVEESEVGGSDTQPPKPRKTSLSEPHGAKFATLDSNQSPTITGGGAAGAAGDIPGFTQIVLEMWTEPHDRIDDTAVYDASSAELYENPPDELQLIAENGIIIRTLFTFEQWQNACSSKILIDRLPGGVDKAVTLEVSAQMNPAPRKTIEYISSSFDMCELLTQANEKQVCFLPALGYAESDRHGATRLEVLLARLQQELADSYDACTAIGDDDIPRCVIDAARAYLDDESGNNDAAPTTKQTRSNMQRSASGQEQLTVRCASVSPPLSSNSSSSFQFEKTSSDRPKRGEKPPAQFYPENFDHNAYLETLCEHRSTSVPLLPMAMAAAPTLPRGEDAPGAISTGSCRLSAGVGCSAFEPIVHKSALNTSQHWSACLPNKSRLTAAASLLAPTRSASNVIGIGTAAVSSATAAGGNSAADVGSGQDSSIKKKHSASTFSNDELSFPGSAARISLRVPTKKLSAPPQAVAAGPGSQPDVSTAVGDHIGQLSAGSSRDPFSKEAPSNCQWKVYAKRLNFYRIIFLIVPREVRTIQAFHPAVNNTFPIFVFHCDKARIAHNLAEVSYDFCGRAEDVLVENFIRKSESSTLAYLKQQIERRARREARRAASAQVVLELYFVNAAVTTASLKAAAGGGTTGYELPATVEDCTYTIFDLANYCELVFEEYIYTKCYIATVYACLGQEIYVPPTIINEVMDYRCEHIRVEIGSINEILMNTCVHMRRGVEWQHDKSAQATRRRCRSSSKSRRKTQKLFSSSSSSSSSESETEDDNVFTSGGTRSRHSRASASTSITTNVDVLFDNSPPENDQAVNMDADENSTAEISCEEDLDDFRQCFDELLKQHSFVKVPGVRDYFFYWPQPTFLLNQQKMLDNVIEDMSHILTPGTGSHLYRKHRTGNSRRTSVTLRSSAKNASADKRWGSIDTSGAFVDEFSNDSSDVGGYYDGSDEAPDNDDSTCGLWSASHSDELFGELNNWPIFVQFSASIYVAGQVHSVSIEFVPNCLQDILQKCPKIHESEFDNLSDVEVSIDMYVFTWPLPSQCSYKECLQFYSTAAAIANTDAVTLATAAVDVSENTGAPEGKTTATAGSATVETGNVPESFQSSVASLSKLATGLLPARNFCFPQTLNCYSAFQADENDEVFEQPVEILRQIPAYEHRLLRKIQSGIQRMLKMEYILISSREFETRPRLTALRRVMRFVVEEIDHINKQSGTIKTTDRRCALMCKELVIVSNPQFGLSQLYERLDGLKINYCTLRRFRSPSTATQQSPRHVFKKRVSRFLADERTLDAARDKDVLFYACRADSAEEMARSIVTSHRIHQQQLLRRPAEFSLRENEGTFAISADSLTNSSDFSKQKMLSGSSIVTIPHMRRSGEDGRITQSSSSATMSALGGDEFDASAITDAVCGVDDDEILSDITMPLNDGERPPLSITMRIKDAMNIKTKLHHLSKGHAVRHLLYDFWLVVQIVQKKNENPVVKIYFCNRSPAIHTDLFVNACHVVEEQIKIVNQTLLLEKMHRTEECDPLLVDTDSVHNLSGHQIPLQPKFQTTAAVQTAQQYGNHHFYNQTHHMSGDRPNASLSCHVAQFVQQQQKRPATRQKGVADNTSNQSSGSLSNSDEEDDIDAERDIGDLVRYTYGPGFFACDMKWHCWFPIHRRLRSTGTDNGFIGLRVGLEQLAVRNRSNMYVYREKSKNVVYMRLHSNADSIFANIPVRTESWRDEVLANSGHSVLLAVHGVNPPGEEITVQLRNVLQRRLNKKTLEEIQNALRKNANIRLEWSDIHFIQNDPKQPDSVLYFTVPSVAQDHLLAVKHYFMQQLQTFCILPKFREQSGMYVGGCHHHATGLYHYHGSHYQQHGSSSSSVLKSHSSSGDFSATVAAAECDCGGGEAAMRRSQHAIAGASGLHTPPQSHSAVIAATPISFLPFVMENGPSNPQNYIPTFFLFNKPAGEGKRDTGIACLEMKLVDWRGAVVETSLLPTARSLLYPSVQNADKHQRTERFQIISKCLQIEKLDGTAPINGTCALFQFNIWKNGNVEIDELQVRLKMCAQQAITDLITEFGLLSAPIFEANFRPSVGSFSFPVPMAVAPAESLLQSVDKQVNAKMTQLQRQNAQDPTTLDIGHPVSSSATRRGFTTESSTESNTATQTNPTIVLRRPNKQSGREAPPVDTRRPLLKQKSQLSATADSVTDPPPQGLYQYIQKAGGAVSSTASAYAVSSFSPIALPLQNFVDNATIGAISGAATTVADEGVENLLFSSQSPMYQQSQRHNPPLAAAVSPQYYLKQQRASSATFTSATSEILRSDFAAVVADWFDHVYSTTKGFPEMSHSVRKFNFLLDCDGSTRKVIQVIYERLRQILRFDKIVLCRGAASTIPSMAATDVTPKTGLSSQSGRHLSTSPTFIEPFEKDCGRIVFAGEGASTEFVLLSYPEHQFSDTIQYGSDLSVPAPNMLQKLVTESNQSAAYSKFLPSLRPFVPRQRIMYLVLSDENVILFLYNYNNDVVLHVKEVVERTILWHNARSRLLREIGLQKMGITHLSTLKSADMKINSYLLLSWMYPELLVRNDYPADSLTTPDFSKMPRTFAQFLLKLYRFYDPAFVAKNLNVFPFEDQTQQMLTLREDVRTMLSEQQIFGDVYRQLLHQQRSTLPIEFFNRIIGRSRQVHYVQSPLLIFPNWRRIIGSVRNCGYSTGRRGCPLPSKHTTSVSSGDHNKSRSKTGKLMDQVVEIINAQSEILSSDHHQSRLVVTSEDSCLVKIQQMLLDDYVIHLRMLGLSLLNISTSRKEPDTSLSRSMHYDLNNPTTTVRQIQSGGSVGSWAQLQTNDKSRLVSDGGGVNGIWLFAAMPGGILFVQLIFSEPYFCVRIFQWNNTRPISLPNSPSFKAEINNIRHLERKKNELIQKCHVHSFTYDFHLRIVSRYLTGGKQNLLLAGYNMNAFLTDFLQYYECRPPNARNCLYEETLKCGQLQVGQSNIWEFFLDNKTQFAWNVIRLKTIDANTADKFMLVSKSEAELLKQNYKLVRMVFNNNDWTPNPQSHTHLAPSPAGAAPSSRSANSSAIAPSRPITAREHEIALKFYVMLVNEEMTYPIIDELKLTENEEHLRSRDHTPSGEFTRIYNNSTASSLPVDSGTMAVRRSSNSQHTEQQHYYQHRSVVGAKFSYCCETAAALSAADNETRVENVGVQDMARARATSLAGRWRSVPPRHLQTTASTGEIAADEAADNNSHLFLADLNETEGSSGDDVSRRSGKQSLTKINAGSICRISDASSILPTSLVPNLGRLFASNTISAVATHSVDPAVSSNSASPEIDRVEATTAYGDKASSLMSFFPAAQPNSSPTPVSLTSAVAEISFQKIPPRRHFRFGQDSLPPLREYGGSAVVPPEQIVYFHYLSGIQRNLQALLEKIVDEKRAQLLQFVHEADRLCHIDMLWRALLSCKSAHVRRQPTTLFSAATISKSDMSSEAAFHKSIKLSGSVEMDFAALLQIIRLEPMAAEEPRLSRLLAEVNFAALCRFFLQYYESEHRCRYFVHAQKLYLIITNPSFFDSAVMFRNDPTASPSTEMFLFFKHGSRAKNENFCANAIQKLFEDIVACLSAFVWSDLLHNPPLL